MSPTLSSIILSFGSIVGALKYKDGVYVGTDSKVTKLDGSFSFNNGKFEIINDTVVMLYHGSGYRKETLMDVLDGLKVDGEDLSDVEVCSYHANRATLEENVSLQQFENLKDHTIGAVFIGYSMKEKTFLICRVDNASEVVTYSDYALAGNGGDSVLEVIKGVPVSSYTDIDENTARNMCLKALHLGIQLRPDSCGGDKYIIRIDNDGIHEVERVVASDTSFSSS